MSPEIIRFVKATGAGNDFVVIDDRDGRLHADRAVLARTLCDRFFGIGGDGLLVLSRSSRADFRMEYYNADGSSGGMCGNGGRVMARFAAAVGAAGTRTVFEAVGRLYRAEIRDDAVSLELPDCDGPFEETELRVGELIIRGVQIDTGAPHFVVFPDDLERYDIQRIGKELRNHTYFRPEGTNVDFVVLLGENTVRLRTYERGVERETLACGTGAVASAVAAAAVHGMRPPVTVEVRSGEMLTVRFVWSTGGAGKLRLEGSADLLYSGSCQYAPDAPSIRIVQGPGKLP